VRSAELLTDAFGRISGVVHDVLEDLTPEQLIFQPDADSNTIAWLVWHLTRIQDDHIAAAFGSEQVWIAGGWCERFALPFDRESTGYGHTPQHVLAVRVESSDVLRGYHDAVHERTIRFLGPLRDADLDRIVDESWDPPVSLGVRLVSVIADDLQHGGQAAYLRGLLQRR
jgi:uncharacterized damage-inducible protein DinB